MPLADRGYDADWNEVAHRRAAHLVQHPAKKRSQYSAWALLSKQPSERFINKIKQWWRFVTRNDRLAATTWPSLARSNTTVDLYW